MLKPLWAGNTEGLARILVTGVGGNVAQGILKALAACKLASWVVGSDANPLGVGLYLVDKGYVVPKADDPAFVSRLIDILNQESIELVLVGADAETIHLANYRAAIESDTKARILVSSSEVVARCHDKWQTSRWCTEYGVAHPQTVLADDQAGLAALVEKVGFPLITKPRYGFASLGVNIVRSIEELNGAAARLGSQGIVQDCVGRDDEEFTAATFSSLPGQVDAVMVLHRELLQGTSYRIEPIFDTVLTQTVRLWGEKLGGIGAINFQFRLTSQGPVCFEINARFSGTTGVRYLFGYNDVDMAIRCFVLRETVYQPNISAGTVMRYWNEFFMPELSLSTLSGIQTITNGNPDLNKNEV